MGGVYLRNFLDCRVGIWCSNGLSWNSGFEIDIVIYVMCVVLLNDRCGRCGNRFVGLL